MWVSDQKKWTINRTHGILSDIDNYMIAVNSNQESKRSSPHSLELKEEHIIIPMIPTTKPTDTISNEIVTVATASNKTDTDVSRSIAFFIKQSEIKDEIISSDDDVMDAKRVKDEFVGSLDETARQSLPAITILKVFEQPVSRLITSQPQTSSPRITRNSTHNIISAMKTASNSSSIVSVSNLLRRNDRRFAGIQTKRFIGMKEVQYSIFDNITYYQGNETEITIVAVSTPIRLFFIPYLAEQWKGQYCIVMYCKKNEYDSAITTFKEMTIPPRISVIFYVVPTTNIYYNDFPVNLLRNIGIRTVRTSHFLMLDMDMWVSLLENMYEEITRIPHELLVDSKNIFIIPTIFLNKYSILRSCNGMRACVLRGWKIAPKNKEDIIRCVEKGTCFLGKNKIDTHKYTTKRWLSLDKSLPIIKFACLKNLEQEPYYFLIPMLYSRYFIVRFTSEVPLYHEGFINYGFNKIQYFEQLRLQGAQIYLLAQSFAVDMPHPDSNFRKAYVSKYSDRSVSSMELLYKKLRIRWIEENRGRKKISVCKKGDSQYSL